MTQKEIKDKIADWKNRLKNPSVAGVPSAVTKINSEIAQLEAMLEKEQKPKAEKKDYVVWEYGTYKVMSYHPTRESAEKASWELSHKNKGEIYSFGSIEKYNKFKKEDETIEKPKTEKKEKVAKKSDLEKELSKLQRELNSTRLSTYIEGDNSDEAKANRKEREVKLARFNEVLALLNKEEPK